jgi:hypothetical protein
MSQSKLQSPPIFPYFILFGVCGGWLMVLLTVLFWEWSGMASIGVFYLVVAAPLITALLAVSLHRRRSLSVYHRTAYGASLAYCGLLIATVAVWLCVALLNP